jgi:radical SAM protein with 4Fe4S-binding SPASM domain
MYPYLLNSKVRGCSNDFFIQNTKSGDEFSLDDIQADILMHCDGLNTIASISKLLKVDKDDIMDFLNTLNASSLVSYSDNPLKKNYPNLTKSPYLQDVQIELTGQCNLWCKHCYGREEFRSTEKDELTTEQIFKLIDDLYHANVANVYLTGGEVFIRKDLPAIIDYIAKKDIVITGIFTNGTLFRDDVFTAFKNNNIKPTILVSLDGNTSTSNDFIRGIGNFNKTIDFIQKVISLGFNVTVNTVVMKNNVKNLIEMRVLLEQLGVKRWRISVPREQGEMIINKDLVEPDWCDVFNIYEKLLLDTLSKTENRMKIQLSSIFKTEYFDDKSYYLFSANSGCCEYKVSSLVINANGNVTPCPAFTDLAFGNIKSTPILDIWYSEITQSFKTLPINLTECKDCDIVEYCGGGCRSIAWLKHSNILAKDDNACPLYRFFYERIRPIFNKYGIKEYKLEPSKDYVFNVEILKSKLAK